MKKLLPFCASFIFLAFSAFDTSAQCTLTNATSCVCENGSTDCDLLPDLTISWYGISNYQGGPTEYSQSGNGANDGRLRITGSTPNIGYGPLHVRAEDDNGNKLIVCGTDTFTVPASTTFTCPNGETPKQILRQRIFHKTGNFMTYTDHLTPPMTYSNSSMYVDDWGIFTLRLQLPNDPDPRNWPIVGSGKKRAFCLMNYGSCSTYLEHCRDDNTMYQGGVALQNGNFPNWGLGNNYGCSPVEQGIASGYTDIYSENLDGMWITIPPNTCNGDYWIYYELDPHNYFIESDETNNYTLVPVTLTLQSPPGNPVATVSCNTSPYVCGNDSVILTANAGFDFLWSNGATTQSIKVGPGTYSVAVTNHCGTAVSPPFTVTSLPTPPNPVTTPDTVCVGDPAQLSATGSNITWFDSADNPVGTGNLFTTPPLLASEIFYAQDENSVAGVTAYGAKPDSSGGGGYFTGSQYLIFTTYRALTLKSVRVYSNASGTRTIEIQNSTGQVLQSGVFSIPLGESVVNLNFPLPIGTDLRITVNGTPNLWRNNSGVSYPYTITDTLEVTGSSAGSGFYYFFYDWEVETGASTCASLKMPVEAKVNICTGINPESISSRINVYPNPVRQVVNISFVPAYDDDYAVIELLDLAGKVLRKERISLRAGKEFNDQLNVSQYTGQVILMKFTINNTVCYRRVMVL